MSPGASPSRRHKGSPGKRYRRGEVLTHCMRWCRSNLNFYRLHLLWFTVVPLVASGIFYASNGTNKISYIDCLFMTVSPMTMTGLETVLMASLTTWQQVLMFLLMIIGSTSSISIVMILVRLRYFKKRFHAVAFQQAAHLPEKGRNGGHIQLDMIKRVDSPLAFDNGILESARRRESIEEVRRHANPRASTSPSEEYPEPHPESVSSNLDHHQPQGVQFDSPDPSLRYRPNHSRKTTARSHDLSLPPGDRTLTRTRTIGIHPDAGNFGGFPNPVARLTSALLTRRAATLPRTTTLASVHTAGQRGASTTAGAQLVNYLTFDAEVGRNSNFHKLTSEQEEELGGVEYRALSLLLRVVVGYWFGMQLLAILVLAPWLSTSGTYKSTFNNPGTLVVNPTWFTFFQVFSAFSNDGLSLDDANMTDFGRAYLLQIVLGFLILGGNTAFPIFLRIIIWSLSKVVRPTSRTHETLRFLLDHPRRSFIYLFPSYQTWFLAFVLAVLDCIDWFAFLVLDIGNPVIESIPIKQRVLNGLFQALSVRSGGFAIVNLSKIAPALQFLYLVMMYIGVYPIAISIRSTNVYEEKSMGIFDEDIEEDERDAEGRFDKSQSATSYVAYHVRRQLSFDLWWLALAVFLICVIERRTIEDGSIPWITVFTIMFEVSSSYGTVGLSLGTPLASTSLSGAFRTLSKLVIIFVMIRGRHRGLPIAIDRAVMLPSEAHTPDETPSVEDEAGEMQDSSGGRH